MTAVSMLLRCLLIVQIIYYSLGASFILDQCPSDSYFDSNSLACNVCSVHPGRVPSSTSINVYGVSAECTCGKGSIFSPVSCDLTTNAGCQPDFCSACPAGSAPSRDKKACIPCGASTLGYAGTIGDCACPTSLTNTYILVETDSNGEYLPSKECVACGPRTRSFWTTVGIRSADFYTCQSCSDPHATILSSGLCQCDTGYRNAGVASLLDGKSRCLAETFISSATAQKPEADAVNVYFRSVMNTYGEVTTGVTRITSVHFRNEFTNAAVYCRGWKPGELTSSKACHALANMCVSQLYDLSTTVCSLAQEIIAQRALNRAFLGWALSMPLLWWGMDMASLVVDTSLPAGMAFKNDTPDGEILYLHFYLASYSFDGAFLGIHKLGKQLNYCTGEDGTTISSPPWSKFGTSYDAEYSCNLRDLLISSGETVYYDLYIADLSDDNVSIDDYPLPPAILPIGTSAPLSPLPLKLYPVPVRITNYRDQSGRYRNKNKSWKDESDDVVMGRFTLWDAQAGISSVGQYPEIVRYASEISLSVQSTAQDVRRIVPPILTITYKEAQTSHILSGHFSDETISLKVQYSGPYSGYSNVMTSIAVAVAVIVCILASVDVARWNLLNAREENETEVSLKHFRLWWVFLIETTGIFYFWFIVIACLYWLIYFKLQDSVYALMPPNKPEYSDNAYRIFLAGLWFVFSVVLLRLTSLIYKQVRMDILFVDWEKPKGQLLRTAKDVETGIDRKNNAFGAAAPGKLHSETETSPVSVWRTIMAANQWSNLTINRRISPLLTLTIVAAILDGGKLHFVATERPDAHDLTPGVINPILQFANVAFWYFVVVAIQYVLSLFIWERYVEENPSNHFIDLCTILKISVLFMDAKYRGYYVHGNSPHEFADTHMEQLALQLSQEASNVRTGRSLPGCPDSSCQSFELHFSGAWRARFDNLQKKIQQAHERRMGGSGDEVKALTGGPSTGEESLNNVPYTPCELSSFFKQFIEETDPNHIRKWKNRTVLQAAFDFPPNMILDGSAKSRPGDKSMSEEEKTNYIYLDPGKRFERLTFRGIEIDLIMWECLLFCIIEYSTQNATISAAVVYAVWICIRWIRTRFGQQNLAMKTRLDPRFL